MKVDVEKQGSVTVFVPRDSLTESSVTYLQDAVGVATRNGGTPRTVYDLGHVSYVDSSGIECLLKLAGPGGPTQPRLAAMNETVREALLLTGVWKRLSVFDSVEAAVRSYR